MSLSAGRTITLSDVKRLPASVDEHGSQTGPRFTLANERTILAWTRTSHALTACVVEREALDVVYTKDFGSTRRPC